MPNAQRRGNTVCYAETSFLVSAAAVTVASAVVELGGKSSKSERWATPESLLPQSSSITVCNSSCRIPRLNKNPAIDIPSTACQTTLSASPNVSRTSSRNGELSVGITGIVANAISTPSGNWARNDAGRFFFSSFCRMVPPTVTPQI
jgi:hypothetical protein